MSHLRSASTNSLGLDLSVMCREPVFCSDSAHESQRRLGQALAAHQLERPQGRVDTVFYRSRIASCELYALRYGAAVEIRPQPNDEFILVQMPLRGNIVLQAEGIKHRIGPGEAAILALRGDARVIWESESEQLILKLPLTLIEDSRAQLEQADDIAAGYPLPALSRLPRPLAVRWLRLVSELLEYVPVNDQGSGSSRWLQHLEQSLPLFLLSHCPDVQSVESGAPPRNVERHLTRLENCMRGHLSQSISLPELASAAGMSIRSLNALCRREYGQSPMGLLRGLRLKAAREYLLTTSGASVTEVSMTFGFNNAGRFANYYRDCFGELPHQTRLGLTQ